MPFGPLACQVCGEFYTVAHRYRLLTSRFCSPECRRIGCNTPEINARKAKRYGLDHPVGTRHEWKGVKGVMVKTENGWEREHRVVAGAPTRAKHEQHLIVHHRNGDPTDNRPENLEVMTQAEHARLHDPERERDSMGRFV